MAFRKMDKFQSGKLEVHSFFKLCQGLVWSLRSSKKSSWSLESIVKLGSQSLRTCT